ncbi:MAG: hypothetical protein JSU87_02720 [Gemmatimonadota bacterium]|nr:MAG: hypothetical protein JSU87_02720 [Gemmatimonadota bacterium]
MRRRTRTLLGVALLLLGAQPELRGQDRFISNGVVFTFQGGYKAMGGDLGKVLDGGVIGEYGFAYQAGDFRYGLALNLVSLDVADVDESVSQVGAMLFARYVLRPEARVQPYGELRLGGVRYRPEGDAFAPVEPPEDGEEPEGENPADAVNGFEGGLLAGVEFALSRKVAFDLSGAFSYITTEEVDLTAIDLGTVDKGTAWSLRLGVRWLP